MVDAWVTVKLNCDMQTGLVHGVVHGRADRATRDRYTAASARCQSDSNYQG